MIGEENEKDYKFFKVLILLVQSFIIGLCIIFFIGVSKVDALGYNQRYFNANGTALCTNNTSSGSCTNTNGDYFYSLYRINYNSSINANNDTTLLWKFTHANNFKIPFGISEDTANNLNKVSIPNIYVITTNGSTIDITDSCTGIASVKTTFNSSTNNLKQWSYTISCQYNVSSATNGVMLRVTQSSATLSPWINTIGYTNGSFNVTNNPSDSDKLINAFNGIASDIISAINEKNNETNEKLEDVKESVDVLNGSVEDLTDALTSENPPNINNIQVTTIDDTPISSLLLLPLSLIDVIMDATDGVCVDYTIGSLFGHTLKFKCINIENIIGSTLYHTIDILMAFFMIYEIFKMFITAFNDITSLRDGFDSLYEPRHAEYKPRHGAGYERIGD